MRSRAFTSTLFGKHFFVLFGEETKAVADFSVELLMSSANQFTRHGACKSTLKFISLHGLGMFDVELYALVDGVIFKIDVLQFFKICLFF